MGEAAASGASRLLKVVFYLVVIGASSCTLYGLVQTARPLSRCSFGSSVCVLFGNFDFVGNSSGAADKCPPDAFKGYTTAVGGNQRLCEFSIASAAGQLVLAIAACGLVLYRLRQKKPGRSGWSVPELLFVLIILVVSLATAVLITIGLMMFCERLTNHWNDDKSIYPHIGVEKPGHCREALLTMDGKTATVGFYKTMNTAMIGSWIAAVAWLLHFLLSLCGVISFRRHGATPRDPEREKKAKKEKKEKKEQAKKEKKEKAKHGQKKSRRGNGHKVSAWERDETTARLV